MTWTELQYVLQKNTFKKIKKTFLVGNDAVVLHFNSSRKVFNLKQIAFRETGSSLSVVNTQCNSHPRLSDLQITQLLIKCEISVSRISLFVFSLVHLHSWKVTKRLDRKLQKVENRQCNKNVGVWTEKGHYSYFLKTNTLKKSQYDI